MKRLLRLLFALGERLALRNPDESHSDFAVRRSVQSESSQKEMVAGLADPSTLTGYTGVVPEPPNEQLSSVALLQALFLTTDAR